jgi:protein-S-isoprenylcysteine O-methyltransferase
MSRRKAATKQPSSSLLNAESDPNPSFEPTNPLSSSNTMSTPNGAPIHISAPLPIPSPQYLTGGARSLPGISLRSFLLGCVFSLSLSLAVQLSYNEIYLWRLPFFFAALSLFHYLEFDMTSRYNPGDAKVDSFLLSANGRGYNAAHGLAAVEVLGRGAWRGGWLGDGLGWFGGWSLPTLSNRYTVGVGFLLLFIGQAARSLAMARAGSSFNHLVQSTKRDDHVLVTKGIYAFSRHPSYFGFFWWGLGTQLVLGNWVCFVVYAGILFVFFRERVRNEERFLVRFFGEEYERYRERTGVWIPGIR